MRSSPVLNVNLDHLLSHTNTWNLYLIWTSPHLHKLFPGWIFEIYLKEAPTQSYVFVVMHNSLVVAFDYNVITPPKKTDPILIKISKVMMLSKTHMVMLC